MPESDRLIYLALGGAGEIGMNMYVYGYGPAGAERLLVVDCGVTFPSMENTPGVDLIMPDTHWLQARADRIEAIVITHAHEDHVGALGHLFPRLKAPAVYARRFTAANAKLKMERAGQDTTLVRQVDPWPRTIQAGPFTLGFVPVSHSIPEASSIVIDTPAGRIVHSADFKVDPSPVVGEPFDPALFGAIGESGVKALICDSTNVFVGHPGRSEASLSDAIGALMREARGLVVATTFASNVARLKTLAEAAEAAGRSIVVLGRAMRQMLATARTAEVLASFPPVLDPADAADLPRENLFVLATGSQGERRAASAQLAAGSYQGFELREGDTFLFSSKTIPGNEVAVSRILNQLSERGVRTIDDADGRYHVSGHPNRPDLVTMHNLLRPRTVIPNHGEHRHLAAHAELARELGRAAVVAPNGAVVELTGEQPRVVEHVETGRVYLDGSELIGAMDGVVRDRVRMALRGHMAVSVIFDEQGKPMGGTWVEARGVSDTRRFPDGLAAAVEQALDLALGRAKLAELADDAAVERVVTQACNRVCLDLIGKKPFITIMISRLG
jgi:ribonuclease J